MYYVCKPTKIQIYINTGLKSIAAIKKELGCDVIINGGLYDLKTYSPDCWLRVDGRTLHSWQWSAWGYGWNTNDLCMDTSVNINKYRNYIYVAALLRNGEYEPLNTLDPALRGIRGRSAIGTRASGEVVLWCTADGAYALSPEQLREEMRKLGCKDAMMLDSGSSSHCIFPNGSIPPSKNRVYVQNYIALWTKPVEEKPVVPTPECPYTEPAHNIRWGSLGNGAKWVQWQLCRHGVIIDVDGLFFGQSVGALRSFQAAHGLTNDGVCGPLTREELKK